MEHLSPNISITSMVLNIPIKRQKLAGKHTIKLSNHMLSTKIHLMSPGFIRANNKSEYFPLSR